MTAPVGFAPSPQAPLSNAAAGGQMGKNEFIKLLVAQMTHQDPLNPMDGQQMAAQLAQFSSVEQLMNIGEKVDAQSAAFEAMLGVVNNSSAIDLIGKTVYVLDDQVAAGPNGTRTADVQVPAPGGTGTVAITDAAGNVVRSVELGELAAGERTLDVADLLDGLPDGPYRIAVTHTLHGESTPLPTRIAAQVDGVQLSHNGAFVTAGALLYPIGLIESIRAGLSTF